MTAITAMTSRGQLVLPIAIRRRLKIEKGAQFLVVSDNENIILKPIKDPAIDEFYTLIQKAQEEAKRIGLTEADIDSVIKEVRQEKRK